MRKTLTLTALLFTSLLIANAQNKTNNQMTDRTQQLEDKLALKELVDNF
jgi:hypothetical protein